MDRLKIIFFWVFYLHSVQVRATTSSAIHVYHISQLTVHFLIIVIIYNDGVGRYLIADIVSDSDKVRNDKFFFFFVLVSYESLSYYKNNKRNSIW